MMLIGVLALLPGALAFAGTHPLIAIANNKPLRAIQKLSPWHPSNSRLSVFEAPSRQQQQQQQFGEQGRDDGLCDLDRLLLVSVPGLHETDIALLPASSSLRDMLSFFSEAEKHDQALHVPYVEQPKSKHGPVPEEKLAKRFVSECGASIGTPSSAGGKNDKVLNVMLFDHELEYLPFKGKEAKEARGQAMLRLDNLMTNKMASYEAGTNWLVVVTDLPDRTTDELRQHIASQQQQQQSKHARRQLLDDDRAAFEPYEDDVLSSLALGFLQDDDDEGKNGTSIFAPPPNSGILARYVLFTPSILLCVLVGLLVFLPAIYFGSQVLQSVTTLHGLEHKMTGSTNVESSKST